MLVTVLAALSVLHLARAAGYSPYQWQPVYQRPAEGHIFGPRLDYHVSVPQSYQDVVTYRNGYDRPPQTLLADTRYPEVFNDRNYRPPHESAYNHSPPKVFQERDFTPYHNHFSHHGPPPPPQHDLYHSQRDKHTHQRPQHQYPAHDGFGGLPNRDGFTDSRTAGPLEVIYSWKQVDFEFPNDNMREEMIRNQQFIPRNNLILDMDVNGQGSNRRMWVTLPRVRPGVPVTLATVSRQRRGGTNLLRPFPDWQSHFPGDCQNSITSVFRTHVDQCGKLWVLDSGNNNAFVRGESRIVCPPQILIYDLNNHDQLIGRYRFPDSMIANTSLLVTINVDSRTNDCSDAVAYMADSMAFKLLAFRLQTGQFWSMNSSLFHPYPDQTMFSVNGVNFELSGGIFGLTLGPVMRRSRQLYFHCIDSVKQSRVDTADIEDARPWLADVDAKPGVFRELNGSRSSQAAAAAMDDQGVMFFGLIGSNEMACWNSRTSFGQENIVVLAKDDTNLQFNSGIKVYDGKLYVVTSRLQNYVTSQVREQEENYRILVADLRTLTRGTRCAVDAAADEGRFHPNDYQMFNY